MEERHSQLLARQNLHSSAGRPLQEPSVHHNKPDFSASQVCSSQVCNSLACLNLVCSSHNRASAHQQQEAGDSHSNSQVWHQAWASRSRQESTRTLRIISRLSQQRTCHLRRLLNILTQRQRTRSRHSGFNQCVVSPITSSLATKCCVSSICRK